MLGWAALSRSKRHDSIINCNSDSITARSACGLSASISCALCRPDVTHSQVNVQPAYTHWRPMVPFFVSDTAIQSSLCALWWSSASTTLQPTHVPASRSTQWSTKSAKARTERRNWTELNWRGLVFDELTNGQAVTLYALQ